MNCASDFEKIPGIVNGASDTLVDIFGENGKHISFLSFSLHSLYSTLVLLLVFNLFHWVFLLKLKQSLKYFNIIVC